MDSANSGSMQSSSGGDDQEFDSRGESISSFLNPSPHFGSISATHQPPVLAHQQNPTFFDNPLLSHNHHDHHPTQYNNDNDLIWSRGLRSHEHNYPNFGNLTSASLPSRPQSIQGPSPGPSSSAAVAPRADAEGQAAVRAPLQGNVTKNPKKRTRASRRAPTTVLTTDTTNFRQMVQEFTGIPAAPFSGSPYSRRMDLFSAASALRSGGHLDNLGPLYPLGASAHKILSPFSSSPPPPSLLNSAMIDAAIVSTANIGNTTNNNNNRMTTTAAATLGASTSNNPNKFPLSGDHLMNLQPSLIGKLQLGANPSMDFGNLSGFMSRENPSATGEVRNISHDDNLKRWRSGETVGSNDGVQENLVGFDGHINSSDHIGGGYNLNLAEKGMENAGSSGAEGTVSSWICPSD